MKEIGQMWKMMMMIIIMIIYKIFNNNPMMMIKNKIILILKMNKWSYKINNRKYMERLQLLQKMSYQKHLLLVK